MEKKKAKRPAGPAAGKAGQKRNDLLPILAVSLLAGCAACMALLCLFAVILLKTDCDPQMAVPFALVAGCGGAAAAGAAISKRSRMPGLAAGFVLGAVLYALMALAAMLRGQQEFTLHTLLKLAALCSAGALGGAAGEHSKMRKRRIR